MHPRAKSATKSSKSPTSNATGGASASIQFVKGIGPGLGAVFKNRGISTVGDLFYFLPRLYEDRSKFHRICDLSDGQSATVSVRVLSSRSIPVRSGRFNKILEVRCQDESGGILALKWFHAPRGMESRLKPGVQLFASGKVKKLGTVPEMVHPELTFGQGASSSDAHVGRLIPIYTEIEGVPTRVLRNALWEACQKHLHELPDDLPEWLRSKHGLPSVYEALKAVHFPAPESSASVASDAAQSSAPKTSAPSAQPRTPEPRDYAEFKTVYHDRLIFEELFKFEHLVIKQKLNSQRETATRFGTPQGLRALDDLNRALPFSLTKGQQQAYSDLLTDLQSGHPMNRLIQGDVGSGKTVIALLAAGLVAAEGSQSVLMAPTEILAEQHFLNCEKLLGGRLRAALLTGRTPPRERATLLGRLQKGEPLLVIGTHALIEEPVQFANLDLVMIDEQHRFGVDQRLRLKEKGCRQIPGSGKPRNIVPHSLVLTATPIPRTLALTAYGELEVSSICELPPGRSPIKTKIITSMATKQSAYETTRQELAKGHQAYFIYPLINDSEAEGFTQLRSAIAEAERLQNEVLPEFRVGLLHGRLSPEEKAQIMADFKQNRIHALVSTTVVEVGVDVPNATVLFIEHADRFGLSQLHQLRGRIGRGSAPSTCFLVTYLKEAERTQKRLDVLERTQNGFEIAEADLEIRGPGEFLGKRQSGSLPFKIADLVRDQRWLAIARDEAAQLLKEDPEVTKPENRVFRRFLEREGNQSIEWFRTS